MTDQSEQLKHEIEELERQIAAHPFEGLFDRKRADQLYHRLKKKRKELEHALAGPAPATPAPQPVPRAEPIRPVPAVGGGGRPADRVVESKPTTRVGGHKAAVKPKPQPKPATKKPAIPTKTKAKSKPPGSGSKGRPGAAPAKSVKPNTKKKSR